MPVVSLLPAGITPAYAGNTYSLSLELCRVQDHPRLRGEHPSRSHPCWPHIGSPPPTRGTLDGVRHVFNPCGITPAYAGNTGTYKGFKDIKWDHPRLRGEHPFLYLQLLSPPGSPPPTRGTLETRLAKLESLRITPAYAGNTNAKYIENDVKGDHPRLRGEHTAFITLPFIFSGSPPPTRGTRKWYQRK